MYLFPVLSLASRRWREVRAHLGCVFPGFTCQLNCSIERIHIALQSPYTFPKYPPFSQSLARLAQISSGSIFYSSSSFFFWGGGGAPVCIPPPPGLLGGGGGGPYRPINRQIFLFSYLHICQETNEVDTQIEISLFLNKVFLFIRNTLVAKMYRR